LPAKLLLFRRLVQVDQHDDEQKQHHDAAHVEHDLDGEQELGALQKIEAGYADQGTIRAMALCTALRRVMVRTAPPRTRSAKV
jgi:hypothetical protein